MPGMDFFIQGTHRLLTDKIMLSFDDGPHPLLTPKTLDILKDKDVKAMFFLIGKNVEEHPEIVRRIIDEGHMIGGHTYEHVPSIGFKFGEALETDIMKVQGLLSDISGREEKYFRPPFGVTNPNIAGVLKRNGLQLVGWSLRTYDTAKALDSQRIEKVVEKTQGGDIVLLHERKTETCQALAELIDGIRNKGMEFGLLTDK